MEQSYGVKLIEGDRHALGDKLRSYHFDVIFDITAYSADDVNSLLDSVGSYDDYILMSSSAVYPEYSPQPFSENTPLGKNKFWGKYGTDKIEAEQALIKRNPNAYILRPPYLYGPMNNVYRESFAFECALRGRTFYLPLEGQMNLQFFHINDLCRFMDIILQQKPEQHIFNVGNVETISIRDWITLCYKTAGKNVSFAHVDENVEQRNYFSFFNYEYALDVSAQNKLMPETKSLEEGLQESFEWYVENPDCIKRKPYISYIDAHFKS